MNNLHNRVKQLENQHRPTPETWQDFVTGAWQPNPQEWAAFGARCKPSEIVMLADELIANGTTPTDEDRARLDALRRITG